MFGYCRPPRRHSASPPSKVIRNDLLLRASSVILAPLIGPRRSQGSPACGMIAGVSGIYDEPELYELACAYRDIPAEVTALQAWCAIHHAGPVSSVIELAPG